MTENINQNQGCFTAILRLFGIGVQKVQSVPATESLPYRVRDDFLSPAEMSFYRVLWSVAGKQAMICPKVNLPDIFFVVRPNENQAYRNRIAQKHLDFLLCEPKSMRPIVGIELDDARHTRSDRQARDEFVSKVFQAAGLPLVHIPVQASYNLNELSAQLAQYLGGATESTTATPAEPTHTPATTLTAPPCPKCGIPMVVRTVARGERQGKQFYGCPNYPKCRETLPLQQRI